MASSDLSAASCAATSRGIRCATIAGRRAAEGHDILSIMFELSHALPDMASMYVNKRLELKKNALLRKGGG